MIPFVLAVLQAGDPYAQLASAIVPEELKAVEAYFESGGPLPGFLNSEPTRLSVEKAVARRWEAVLSGIERAAGQPYSAGKVDAWRVLALAKVASWSARPRFAEGNQQGAVTLLLSGLTMAERTHSSEGESVILRCFSAHLSSISLIQWNRVLGTVRSLLETPSHDSVGLRLLRAHARIEAFRWQRLKLPSALKEAMPAPETLDGANGRPLRYEQTAGGYVLQTEPKKDGTALSLSGPIPRETERY